MTSPVTLEDLMAVMMAQQAEIRRLAAAVEALSPQAPPPDADPGAEALVQALVRHVGAASFTARELIMEAARHAPQLGAALVAALPGKLSPKRVGKLLQRVEGQDFGGWIVERVCQDRDGVRWRVCEFASLQTRETRTVFCDATRRLIPCT